MDSIVTLIITALIVGALVVFRAEVRHLVHWVTSFKKISRNAEGFSLEGGGDSEPLLLPPNGNQSLPLEVAIEASTIASASAENGELSWVELSDEKRFDDALRALDDNLAKASSDDDRIRIRSYQASVEISRDFAAGRSLFENLMASYPTSNHPYVWLALEYWVHKLFDEATTVLKRGLEQNPESVELADLAANSLIFAGRVDEAISLVKSHPSIANEPRIVVTIAKALVEAKRGDEATRWFNQGVKAHPINESLVFAYAKFLLDNNDNGEAVFYFKRLIGVAEKAPEYWAYLGNAYLNLEMFDTALKAYTKADELATGSQAWIIANIGNLYNRLGLYTKASEFLQRALQLTPESEYAHERLGQALKSLEQTRLEEGKLLSDVRQKLHAESEPSEEIST